MRNHIFIGLASAATISPAFGADMPLKAPPPPPPAQLYSWSNCYLGGSVGGIWRQNEATNISFFDGGAGAGPAAAAGALPTSFGYSGSSWLAGGQLGCNYQTSNWVFGIETDMSGTNLSAGQALATNVPPFFPLATSVSEDMNWIGTTRGRIGAAWDNILVYATGGVAYANVRFGYTQNNVAGGGPVAIAATDSATRWGWTAGAGLEIGFGAWSLKGEYLYYDLGSHTLNTTCTWAIGILCPGTAPTTFAAHFRDSGSIARFGLNYHL